MMKIPVTCGFAGLYVISFPNGKEYVGMTRKNTRSRLLNHIAQAKRGSKQAVHCAMRKYQNGGIVASVEKAVFCASVDDLGRDEYLSILFKRRKGITLYNMTEGGEGRSGYLVSDETKKKISIANSKKKNCEARAAGVKTESARERMSASAKRSWTDERKEYAASQRRGSLAWQAKLTECDVVEIRKMLSVGDSCAAISRIYKVTPECISRIKIGKSWSHVVD